MNLNHKTTFQDGDAIHASDWNKLAADVNELGSNGNNGEGTDSHVVFDSENKHNLTIQTTSNDQYESEGELKGGKINIEPISDLQIKPGDDITLYAHHRDVSNRDQVLVKVATEAQFFKSGNEEKTKDTPAKLRLNTGDISITNGDNKTVILVEIKDTYKGTPDYYITTDFAEGLFISGYIYNDQLINNKLNTIGENYKLYDGENNNTSVTNTDVKKDIIGCKVGKTRVIKCVSGGTTKYYKFTKVSNDDGITNISIEDSEGYGYLKLRAQSIDLRCEEHGGIALQPKGYDNPDGEKFEEDPTITEQDIQNEDVRFMNKIKFEHGGGDGLEFATFNTRKTSIYTDEYRFNKDGIWKMATRTKEVSDKYDGVDETTHYKYQKQSDDFYDIISQQDETCKTQDIIKAGSLFSTLSDVGQTIQIAEINDLPKVYNIIPITVSDLNNDTNVVNSNWSGPLKTGYLISYDKANISDLLDTMPQHKENFRNAMTAGNDFIVGIDSSHVYKIQKSNITLQDVFALTEYMKSNSQGPWANQ